MGPIGLGQHLLVGRHRFVSVAQGFLEAAQLAQNFAATVMGRGQTVEEAGVLRHGLAEFLDRNARCPKEGLLQAPHGAESQSSGC